MLTSTKRRSIKDYDIITCRLLPESPPRFSSGGFDFFDTMGNGDGAYGGDRLPGMVGGVFIAPGGFEVGHCGLDEFFPRRVAGGVCGGFSHIGLSHGVVVVGDSQPGAVGSPPERGLAEQDGEKRYQKQGCSE